MAKRGKKGVHPLYNKLDKMQVGEQLIMEYAPSYQTYTHLRGRTISKKFKTFRIDDVLTVIRIA